MVTQDIAARLLTPRRYALESQIPTHPEEALENVIVGDLGNGSLCLVLSPVATPTAELFYLDKTSTEVSDGILAIATGTGIGRWLKLCIIGPRHPPVP